MPARRSLTLYAALLFAAVAALVVSAVGFYLYRSVEEAMLRRSDVMVAGRVEHFRNLLRDNLTLAELKARPRLFENMLGNEQDILLLGQPGEAPIVAVNPRHERLPSLRVVAAGQALNPSVVHAALTHDGIPMRVLAAEVLVGAASRCRSPPRTCCWARRGCSPSTATGSSPPCCWRSSAPPCSAGWSCATDRSFC